MRKKTGAYELELRAASEVPSRMPACGRSDGEAMAMLVRRGLRPEQTPGDVPFEQPLKDSEADRLSEWLGHYAFRLFLRGAILESEGFLPAETTRYLSRAQTTSYANVLVDLGLAEKISRTRYRMKHAARNFGGTLEWYVGRELARYGFDVATGIKLHIRGGGGDLDVVAAAEGKLVYAELKSSPPRNLDASEIAAFLDRLRILRPDVSIFVVDTALRLSDKILPMFLEALSRRNHAPVRPGRIAGQQWAITPHLYAVNGRRNLIANIMKAIGEGFRALSPDL
jgi:hypothetical protein